MFLWAVQKTETEYWREIAEQENWDWGLTNVPDRPGLWAVCDPTIGEVKASRWRDRGTGKLTDQYGLTVVNYPLHCLWMPLSDPLKI